MHKRLNGKLLRRAAEMRAKSDLAPAKGVAKVCPPVAGSLSAALRPPRFSNYLSISSVGGAGVGPSPWQAFKDRPGNRVHSTAEMTTTTTPTTPAKTSRAAQFNARHRKTSVCRPHNHAPSQNKAPVIKKAPARSARARRHGNLEQKSLDFLAAQLSAHAISCQGIDPPASARARA